TYGVPALWITCVRMLVAGVFFLLVTVAKDWHNLVAVFRDWRSLVAIATFSIFGVLLTQVSYLFTIGYTDASTGTMLEQIGLVFIMLFVCIRNARLPKPREAAGLVLALIGMLAIATQGNLGSLAIPIEGLAWGLVAAVALAFYTLMPGRVLKKWGSMVVTGLAMMFGGTTATIFVQPWTIAVTVSPGMITAMAAIIVVGTLGAYMLFLQGIADAGPVKASLLCCVEPVSAMVLSVVWLHTSVSVYDVAGCVLILVMVFLVTQRDEGPSDQTDNLSEGEDPPVFLGRASVLGYYTSRVACEADYPAIMKLLDEGHATFAALGINEGLKKYPSARRIMHSIKNGSTHAIEQSDGRMIGMYALSFSLNKQYEKPFSGAWITDSQPEAPSYAVLHWVNVTESARNSGVGRFILDSAEKAARERGRLSIRADVYPENAPMRALLKKYGYVECGKLDIKDYLGGQKTRIAFEKIL
ncbi:MAG: GNAT family N-acetyltransferase, partial [Raoultibacter sp.]